MHGCTCADVQYASVRELLDSTIQPPGGRREERRGGRGQRGGQRDREATKSRIGGMYGVLYLYIQHEGSCPPQATRESLRETLPASRQASSHDAVALAPHEPLRLGNRVFVKWLPPLAGPPRWSEIWLEEASREGPSPGKRESFLLLSPKSIRPACFAKPKTHLLLCFHVDRSGTDPAVGRASCELRNRIRKNSGPPSWKSGRWPRCQRSGRCRQSTIFVYDCRTVVSSLRSHVWSRNGRHGRRNARST